VHRFGIHQLDDVVGVRVSRITDTQPIPRSVAVQRQHFDFQRWTRALQMTAACLGGVVVAVAMWVTVSGPEPTPSRTAEQLTPLGTVIPETTTSSAPSPPPVAQPVRATTARPISIQPRQQMPVITITEPPPEVVIVPAPVETMLPSTTRSGRGAPRDNEPSSARQEPEEPQDSPLIDIGGLVP
jgi:hypothetical protein